MFASVARPRRERAESVVSLAHVSLALSIASAVGACGSGSHEVENAMPETSSDPLPFVPPAAGEGQTGETVGLSVTGGREQARAVALQLIYAIRDADEPALEGLLGDPLGRVVPRLVGGVRTRRDALETLMHAPARNGLDSAIPIEHLVAVDQFRVIELRERDGSVTTPAGFREDDLLVSFPLAAQGLRFLRPLLSWPASGAIVVRSGAEPRIIAF
jgi:hypothetical protein